MSENKFLGVLGSIKNFLLRLFTREFLIFLFFLALSGMFWFLLSLNETYEKEIQVKINLTNIPKNVVLTSDSTSTIQVDIQDKGYAILAYLYGKKLHPININFDKYGKQTGVGLVQTSELERLVYQQLYSSAHIESIKPEKFEYFYNFGLNKRVPVKLYGKITPKQSYYISKVVFNPDSVDIFASREILDSTKSVNTERLNIKNITDTTIMQVAVQQVKGVKYVPNNIRISIYPDVLTEQTLEIPVQAINMPQGKILRTFPSKVNVTFTVGARLFRKIRPDMFSLVVDYNEIKDSHQDKCNVTLRTVPKDVKDVRLSSSKIDYLIEEQ